MTCIPLGMHLYKWSHTYGIPRLALRLVGVIYVAHRTVCCWSFGGFYGLRLGVRYRAEIVGTRHALSLLYFMFSVPWVW